MSTGYFGYCLRDRHKDLKTLLFLMDKIKTGNIGLEFLADVAGFEAVACPLLGVP